MADLSSTIIREREVERAEGIETRVRGFETRELTGCIGVAAFGAGNTESTLR